MPWLSRRCGARLEVEQERFGELLRFHIQVESDIEGLTLPGLTIQPLVENSVKHGLRPKIEVRHPYQTRIRV